MAARAGTTGEFDVLESINFNANLREKKKKKRKEKRGAYLAGVDGNAVILVLDGSAADIHPGTLADVKPVSVVPAVVIPVGVIDGDVDQVEVGRLNTDGLHRCVLDG